MKDNKNREKLRSTCADPVSVQFMYVAPSARSVAIAGTFNNWQPSTKAMLDSGSGHWLKEVFLAPGTYEYCLVVDGEWMPDPRARETVPNPFGGRNSVLRVLGFSETSHLTDAENIPYRIGE